MPLFKSLWAARWFLSLHAQDSLAKLGILLAKSNWVFDQEIANCFGANLLLQELLVLVAFGPVSFLLVLNRGQLGLGILLLILVLALLGFVDVDIEQVRLTFRNHVFCVVLHMGFPSG